MRIFALVFGIAMLVSAGCGGGGGGNGAPSLPDSPKVTVSWPVRTRTINAPSSALSVKFQIAAQGSSTIYSIEGDRPNGLGATTITYSGSGVAPVGSYQLTGTFYSEPGESGVIVGSISSGVLVQSDGTLLNSSGQTLQLNFSGTAKSVSVNPNQSVAVGKSIELSATAFDANDNPIALTAGSFSFAVSGSSADLTVAANGDAQGIAIGSGLVTASVDGLTSSAELVLVGPSSPSFEAYVVTATDIAYDSNRNAVYAACSSNSPTYAGMVSNIELGPNQFGSAFPTTNSPTHVAVSNDGNFAYVAGGVGTIQRIDLATGLIDGTISLPPGTLPNEMAPIPGLPESFAISLSAPDGVTDAGTMVLDGLSFRSSGAKIGLSIAVSGTGTRIYGYQTGQSAGALFSSATIGTGGISSVQSEATSIQGVSNRIHWNQGEIIADSGAVINPDTGATIGKLSVPSGPTLAIPVPGTDVVYIVSESPYTIGKYGLSSLSMNYSVQVSGPSGTPFDGISLGGGRIGFLTSSGNPNAVYSVAGLP
jgi:hypothetical protein